MKIIYKKNTEKLTEYSGGSIENNYYKDFTDQLSVIEKLSNENEKYKYEKA